MRLLSPRLPLHRAHSPSTKQPIHRLSQPAPLSTIHARRSFVTSRWQPERQSLTASRTLAYPASPLYDIIADVSAYRSFIPYCKHSVVTQWSGPDEDGRRWPWEAELRIGWAGYEERFVSAVFCQPTSVMEAVGGEARRTIPDHDIPHYKRFPGARSGQADDNDDDDDDDNDISTRSTPLASDTAIFTHLYTRWTIRPFPFKPPAQTENPLHGNADAPPSELSDVTLKLEFQFANPLYGAMSKAVAPRVGSMIIEAFERRARQLLGPPREGTPSEKVGTVEGVLGGEGVGQSP